MPKAHSPRKRGHDGRAASARFVELEHTLAASGQAVSGALMIEMEGLRFILADQAAAATLAAVFRLVRSTGKGGCP